MFNRIKNFKKKILHILRDPKPENDLIYLNQEGIFFFLKLLQYNVQQYYPHMVSMDTINGKWWLQLV